MSAIGPEQASKLEHDIKRIGHPNPLHYCRSYFHWKVSSLAELTQAQADELTARLRVAVREARRAIDKERERDEQRAREAGRG